MKCINCLFSVELEDENLIECRNLWSDDFGMKLFKKYDGCSIGKSSTVGMNTTELFSLKFMNCELPKE